MRVWIDQDLCTGDGLCEQICPDVFRLDGDGLSYVFDDASLRDGGATDPGRFVTVAEHLTDDVLDAAAECPGECIFLEGSATAAA
jgi:ferredoxin